MSNYRKVLESVLHGSSDASISFNQICQLLKRLGFQERIRGGHHIFTKDGIVEILNLQSKGAKAKPYQVKQVRSMLLKYKLGGHNGSVSL